MQEQEQDEQFVTKKIEQPIMGAEVRRQIGSEDANLPAFNIGFYQTNKFYIWAVVFGIGVISLLTYLAFRKPPVVEVKEANVEITIEAPANIPSGGNGVYTLKLQNNDSQKLTNVRLEIAYPEGITYVSSVPKAEGLLGTTFKIPDLVSGQISPSVIIRTKVSGNVGDSKQIIARMFYTYDNFSAEFVKEKAYTFVLSASLVALELTGPETVSNSQLVMYNLKYKNNSSKPIENSRVRVNFPEGFNIAQSDPAVSLGENVWELGNLQPGAEGQIQIQGTYKSSNPGESKTWSAEFLVFSNGDYNIQNTTQMVTAISSLPLVVSQELQSAGNSEVSAVAKPGDTLTYEVAYQNNSSVAASGVNIIATLASKALDLSTVQAEGGQVNNNTIIWNASGVPNLEILNPSESGTLRFSVRVKNPATKDSSTNLTVVSDIKIKSNESQTYYPGNSLTVKISSPGSLASNLAYVNGQLPPKIGQSTVYKVSLKVFNSTNDYSEGVLTAFIPLGSVNFESQSVNANEAQKFQFDPATGKLTWNLGIVAANVGRFNAPRTLEFNVKLIPAQNQAGQSPTLLKTINFQARDSFTTEKIELMGENITTQSLEDGYGNGTVGQ